MEEKKGKKLLKLLKKWGVSPEEAQAFLDDYDNTPDEEELEVNEEVVDTPIDDSVVEEEQSTDATEVEEVDEPLPPTDEEPTNEEPEIDEQVGEVAEEPVVDEEPVDIPQADEPPMEEQPPVEQPVEQPNEEVEQLKSTIEELKSTLDGVVAKMDAMQENLAKSGLVDYVEEQPVGVDENTTPARGFTGGTESVINRLNQGRNY